MNLRPLGPDGIQKRLSEIEAKIDRKFGSTVKDDPAGPAQIESIPGLNGAIGGGPDRRSGASALPGVDVKPLSPFDQGSKVEGLDRAPTGLREQIHASATSAGVDPLLYEALIGAESDFNPMEISNRGAKGLSQLMPATAAGLGVKNPFDVTENLNAGAKYLSSMMQRFSGDEKLALAAYNAGPGAVQRHGGIPPYPETQNYVNKILAAREAMKRA